ncbi:MAG: hypothetical protein QG665_392 [Patescibacteria group bacterium]|nr:hypothetical protein [Patescibacteria group bacterium]
MEKFNPKEKIVGLSIPDSDVRGWMNELMLSGLSAKEINNFLAHLNKTFADQLKKKNKLDAEVASSKEYLEEKYGHQMTKEAEDYLRRSIDKALHGQEGVFDNPELILEDPEGYIHEQG